MSLREKRLAPQIANALNKCVELCDAFAQKNEVNPKFILIVGRDKPLKFLDLPLKLTIYYLEYNDKVRVDFNIFFSDLEKIEDVMNKTFVTLMEGILVAKVTGIDESQHVNTEIKK